LLKRLSLPTPGRPDIVKKPHTGDKWRQSEYDRTWWRKKKKKRKNSDDGNPLGVVIGFRTARLAE